jgi:hypothetical protein
MRCSRAAMASRLLGHVGERWGRDLKLSTGSRSSDGGGEGEWNVSPFLKLKLGDDDDESAT